MTAAHNVPGSAKRPVRRPHDTTRRRQRPWSRMVGGGHAGQDGSRGCRKRAEGPGLDASATAAEVLIALGRERGHVDLGKAHAARSAAQAPQR